jgi:thiamine-phosphate pyrophosphorylase
MTLPLGLDVFYPLVPDVDWLRRIVPLGVRTVQLRLKDAAPNEIMRQIAASLDICRHHGCQLIVNDYWREAIALGADYIHLGQGDLAEADIAQIKEAGLRLGVSTHDDAELKTALAVEPDYVALGPVYETKLKVMPWAPQGLERVAAWRARVAPLPLVAIGGITLERAPGVRQAGAHAIAVITDFLTHQHPEDRVAAWLAWARQERAGG